MPRPVVTKAGEQLLETVPLHQLPYPIQSTGRAAHRVTDERLHQTHLTRPLHRHSKSLPLQKGVNHNAGFAQQAHKGRGDLIAITALIS
jgi:hypothetical protein